MAKELVCQRFIVGLMDEMNESIRRFNIVLGVDEHNERGEQCMKEFNLFGEQHAGSEGVSLSAERQLSEVDTNNSNGHPKVRMLVSLVPCIVFSRIVLPLLVVDLS